MTDLKREDPSPVSKRSATNWRSVFETLRAAPNEWFSVGEFPAAYVTSIKRGRFAGSVEGEFEATMRNTDSKTQRGTLYVRYIDGTDLT